MKQIKDLPKDWAVYLGDDNMPKWKEALDCYNGLTRGNYLGLSKFYDKIHCYDSLDNYKKTLTPEEFVSHFEIKPTIEDELAAIRYKVGDIITNSDDHEKKVLGVCGLVYFVSADKEPNLASSALFTQKELDNLKFKKKQL